VLLVEYFDIVAILRKESAAFEKSLQIGPEILCIKVLNALSSEMPMRPGSITGVGNLLDSAPYIVSSP
jgi:hypothetical protein